MGIFAGRAMAEGADGEKYLTPRPDLMAVQNRGEDAKRPRTRETK